MDNALRTPSTNHPAAESITAKVAFSSNWPGTLNMHQHKEDILQDRYRSLTNHNLLLTAVCFTKHHLFCHKTIRSYCIIMMSHPITPQTSQLNKLVAKRKKKKKNNAKWAFKHFFFFFLPDHSVAVLRTPCEISCTGGSTQNISLDCCLHLINWSQLSSTSNNQPGKYFLHQIRNQEGIPYKK